MAKQITCEGQDVTEGVQALYDLMIHSMDFGSGFLSEDELVPIFKISIVAGFDVSALERYLVNSAVEKRVGLWEGPNPRPTDVTWQDPKYQEWRDRQGAARNSFEVEEIAALRKAHGF